MSLDFYRDTLSPLVLTLTIDYGSKDLLTTVYHLLMPAVIRIECIIISTVAMQLTNIETGFFKMTIQYNSIQ